MKVIVIEALESDNKRSADTLLKNDGGMAVYTLADTSLLLHGKPMFAPDISKECKAHFCLAVRISRLGKSIPKRFAARYYDAVTVGVRFEMSDLRSALSEASLPWDIAVSFDGAATIGDFKELQDDGFEDGCKMEIKLNDEITEQTVLDNIASAIDNSIALASCHYMLRQGDIMMIKVVDNAPVVQPETHIEGYIGGDRLLNFNVK